MTPAMARLRLRTRLMLWFAAAVLVIPAPLLIGTFVFEWRAMRAALDHHLYEDLEVAAEMVILEGSRVVWRSDAQRDLGYDAGEQRWVEVYGRQREALLLRGAPKYPPVRDAIAPPGSGVLGYRTVQTPAGAYVRTLTVQRTVGPQRVWIRVARSEDGYRADLYRLILVFGVGVPFAVLTAAFAGYVFSGRALAPLSRMADRARSISADHLSERLPVENADDELGQLALVFNDTFARLEASFEGLKQFTADASHELRTPLTAIRSVGEIGLQEARSSDQYQEIIGSMLEEADRLTRVVETLLTLSRWESGRRTPSTEQLDLATVMHEVVAQLSVLAEDRRINIHLDLPTPLMVVMDPLMARQAVANVLDNAIKFTRELGTIDIFARSTPLEHQLIIDDEGPGIPEEQRQRVLERFYRIDRGRGRESGGAGLGLAIVHRAITASRGRIVIEANDAGGARVILILPRADVNPAVRRS